ncbi:MAG: hypothetical protein ACJ79A_16045 [Gemmatimonadaceae bacterium]
MEVSVSTAPIARRADRIFFGTMSIVILAIVFVGFMRTFYLSSYFGRPALSPLRVIHGTAFTSWVVLFAVQTTLIAAGRRDLHRTLGYAGAVLATLMVPLGLTLAIQSARAGRAPPGLAPLEFLIIPVFDMLVFAPLVAAAVYYRRESAMHKRLMLIATVSLLGAALARVTGTPGAGGPLVFFGVADLLLVCGAIYDRRTLGSVHAAYTWGGGFVVASQVLRLALLKSPLWLAIARSLTA